VTTDLETQHDATASDVPRTIARLGLGTVLVIAGIGHFARVEEFRAQVPGFLPATDAIVYASGVVELVLGAALLLAKGRRRPQVGLVAAAFFIAVFPGNIAQLVSHTDAFGLDTDGERAARLLGQPVLVLWALWSTGGLDLLRQWWRSRRAEGSAVAPG
jgi:uncharacterized membrane protein